MVLKSTPAPTMRFMYLKGRDMKPALFILCSFFLGAYLYAVFTKQPVIRILDPATPSIDFRREIADELEEISRDLVSEYLHFMGLWKDADPQIMSRLGSVISRLDPRRALSFSEPLNGTAIDETEEVCGEEYTGGSYSYPFFQVNT
ncbi:hypothetical protein PR048_021376 [Dryococelus australis]|uniref:Uncharacterized protein n=1 Tax=Dryococelus australis TaxID=614101 RepID=A0ABQ9GY29_9NEOP|nr:hypothetical protein PR048_021376 [Dryococelus australis]